MHEHVVVVTSDPNCFSFELCTLRCFILVVVPQGPASGATPVVGDPAGAGLPPIDSREMDKYLADVCDGDSAARIML